MSERKGIIGAGNWIVDNIKYIDRWAGEGNLANILGQERATGGGPANVLFDIAAMNCGIPLSAAGRLGKMRQVIICLRKSRSVTSMCRISFLPTLRPATPT